MYSSIKTIGIFLSKCFGCCGTKGEVESAARTLSVTNTTNCHTSCLCCSQVQMIERSVHNGATSLREPAVLQKPTHLANLDVQLINKPTDLVGQLDVLKSSTESFQTATEELSPLLSPGGFAAHSPFETLHPLAKLYLSFTNPSLVMLLLLVLLFFFVVNKRM